MENEIELERIANKMGFETLEKAVHRGKLQMVLDIFEDSVAHGVVKKDFKRICGDTAYLDRGDSYSKTLAGSRELEIKRKAR